MKTVSVKVASAVVAGLGLTVGVVGMVGAQASGNVGTTGEDSRNSALVTSETNSAELRASEVKATNNNPQSAMSGHATVEDGDDDGTATSGGATNGSTFNGGVTVGQAGGSGAGGSAGANAEAGASGTISGTGEDSKNDLQVHSTDNRLHASVSNVQVTNNNTQRATSGAATVTGGEDGGNATSGNAANTSSSTFNVNVQQ